MDANAAGYTSARNGTAGFTPIRQQMINGMRQLTPEQYNMVSTAMDDIGSSNNPLRYLQRQTSLRYHPDRNSGQEELYNPVFSTINQLFDFRYPGLRDDSGLWDPRGLRRPTPQQLQTLTPVQRQTLSPDQIQTYFGLQPRYPDYNYPFTPETHLGNAADRTAYQNVRNMFTQNPNNISRIQVSNNFNGYSFRFTGPNNTTQSFTVPSSYIPNGLLDGSANSIQRLGQWLNLGRTISANTRVDMLR